MQPNSKQRYKFVHYKILIGTRFRRLVKLITIYMQLAYNKLLQNPLSKSMDTNKEKIGV